MSVTLAQAATIVETALKKGRDTNCAPLTVAVLDAGGHMVAFKREDRSGIMRFDIAGPIRPYYAPVHPPGPQLLAP